MFKSDAMILSLKIYLVTSVFLKEANIRKWLPKRSTGSTGGLQQMLFDERLSVSDYVM